MRLFSPEWDAIKDFAHTALYRDVQFDLSGHALPQDHGYALYEELARHLPWLRETPQAGVHPVHAAPSGRDANLVLNRRVKLVLRLPIERIEAARALVGMRIDPGAGEIVIGDLHEKPLIPFTTLYSHFVDMGTADEAGFMAKARQELESLDVRCGMIPGKHRLMHTPQGGIGGYSLMLHEISMEQSMTVQERGLGLHRGYGCGLFVPHKSIKEVSGG
ncbi:MAG TPA: type I-MYXAN CRISPR-associated protein Cas6/Cmx6 [Thiobacillaceae bacterium]|nr:type I-MYXAN CRISPR-associated protein Cas6/Cmx6 [Thiobacillaceae bacterium]HNU64137.1 type I-MYXAN CRISPR-associated protein Cas6/Cmx6 [Thiobacillaceae bacterium]